MPARRRAPRVLRGSLGPEVDALEHERAQREHRLPHLCRLADVVDALRGVDDVVHEPNRSARSRSSRGSRSRVREVVLGEKPVAHGVVDVVVDVGDAVDEADDLPLERPGSRSPVCVRMPSQVSCVRLSERAIRWECSLCRKRPPKCRGARRRARPRPRARRACALCRARARSPHGGPRSTAARGRRRERSRLSRGYGSCACGSGRPPGR